MKILFLTNKPPYPLLSGYQLRYYNVLTKLNKNNKIILLSYYRSNEELNSVEELNKYCGKTYFVKTTNKNTFDI